MAVLEETQAGIKIAGRSISNLRYADDTTLMADSEEPFDEGGIQCNQALTLQRLPASHKELMSP